MSILQGKETVSIASFEHDLLTFSMVFSIDVSFKKHSKARPYLVNGRQDIAMLSSFLVLKEAQNG